MALQIALDEAQSEVGAPAPQAYAKIVIYTHDVKNDQLQLAVEFHYNHAAKQAGRRPIKGAAYQCLEAQLPAGGGIRAQMYNYLKTLPEFAGAIDV